jgi:hypothetical protein
MIWKQKEVLLLCVLIIGFLLLVLQTSFYWFWEKASYESANLLLKVQSELPQDVIIVQLDETSHIPEVLELAKTSGYKAMILNPAHHQFEETLQELEGMETERLWFILDNEHKDELDKIDELDQMGLPWAVNFDMVRGNSPYWSQIFVRESDREAVLESVEWKLFREKLDLELEYYPKFVGYNGLVSQIHSGYFLDNPKVAALLKDKYVILTDEVVSLNQPLSSPDRTIFQAYMIQSLVKGEIITAVPIHWQLLAVAILCYIQYLYISRLTFRVSFVATLVSITLASAVTILALLYLNQWITPLIYVYALIITFLFYLWVKESRNSKEKRKLNMSVSDKIRETNLQRAFVETDDYWARVDDMLSHNLPIDWNVFLEIVPGRRKLTEAAAFGCSLEDINEKERDLTAEPFKSALKTRQPTPVENFLKISHEDQQQYLMPVKWSREVFAFWVFGISRSYIEENPQSMGLIMECARQMSDILYIRKRWNKKKKQQQKFSLFRQIKYESVLDKELVKSQDLLLGKYNLVENGFNHIDSASILYNFFGRAILVNEPMLEILNRQNLSAYDYNVFELLHHLTGEDKNKLSQYFQLVIRNNEIVYLNYISEQEYPMRIRLSSQDERYKTITADNSFNYKSKGILLQIQDMEYVKNLITLKDQFLEQTNILIRQELSPIVMAADIINTSADDPDSIQIMGDVLNESVQKLTVLADKIESNNKKNLFTQVDVFPFRADEPIYQAIKKLDNEFKQKFLEVTTETPTVSNLLVANISILERVLECILLILIDDATDGTKIKCRLHEQEDTGVLTYEFINEGCGLPEELLLTYFNDANQERSEEFEYLFRSQVRITSWNGSFIAKSEVGKGFEFHISLPVVF